MADGTFRARIRFHKLGRARWLSHLEVMRAFERAVRRANLPYVITKGFNPRIKHAFGPALPVGTAGTAEYVDLWLRAFIPPAELLTRLATVSASSLAPNAAVYVADAEPSLSAALELALYETRVEGLATDVVRPALDGFIATGLLEVAGKKGVRTFHLADVLVKAPDVTPFLGEEQHERATDSRIAMAVRIGERGSMRPEALIRAALDGAGVTGGRLVTTRTGLAIPTDDGPVFPIPA